MSESHVWKVFYEGDRYFEELGESIRSAGYSVALEAYIFDYDHAGRPVLDELISASQRGVSVRLLLDGIGSLGNIDEIEEHLDGSQVRLRVYKPLRAGTLFRSGHQRRNHRKLTVIDSRVMFAGGMNISQEHSLRHSGPAHWRDTMLKIRGSLCRDALASFDEVWEHAAKRHWLMPRLNTGSKYKSGFRIVSNHTIKARRSYTKTYLENLRNAKEKIYIGSAYFIPRPSILRLLLRKAKQGLDVRIMTAGRSDIRIAQLAGQALYKTLLKRGVRIFEYQGRMYHAKTTLMDSVSSVGSSNMDYRSFLHNLELDVWSRRKDVAASLEKQWHEDESCCKEMILKDWKKRSVWRRFLEKISFLFRYYL